MNTKSALRSRSLFAPDESRLQWALALTIRMQGWIIMAVMVGAAAMYHFRPLPATTQAMQQLAALQEQRVALNSAKDRITRRIDWLKDESTGYLELVARDRLDLQREGDVIMRLDK